MDFALVFACSGFLAGLMAHAPTYALSKRLQSRELASQAFAETRSLLSSLSGADFLPRYARTLSLLIRCIGARCTLLTLQIGLMLTGYVCICGMVNAVNAATLGGLHLSDWTFSLSAMLGAGLKTYGSSS